MIYIDSKQGQIDIFSISNAADVDYQQYSDQQQISRKNYIICFTERSGSTMLCSILEKTHLLGMPDEYVNPRGVIQLYLQRYPASNIFQYFDKLRHHRISDNGIFGMKTCFADFEPLLSHQAVAKLLSPVKFIYLTRQDVILQAISAYAARASGVWHVTDSGNAVEPECEYNEAAILTHANRLLFERSQWERFFSLYSIEPLRITYEGVLEDVNSAVKQILCFLDEDSAVTADLGMSTNQKISGQRSHVWAEKIRLNFSL